MPLQAPIDRATHRDLREAVLTLRDGTTRGDLPVRVHAGRPRLHVATHQCTGILEGDTGLRSDIAVALLERAQRDGGAAYTWVSRSGPHSVQDVDLAWLSAIDWAAGATGLSPHFVVVTRAGWFDPVSLVSREWKRLRRSSWIRPRPERRGEVQ